MQRRLHPLEGIVALFALFLVLALTVGFAQAGELGAAPRAQKVVLLRSSAVLGQDAELEMTDSHFVDATGLSKGNVSSARDLAKLVRAAHGYPLIREYSTRDRATVTAFGRPLSFRNTNGLVRSSHWEIGLSKTGYISEAGRCLVMRVRLASKDLIVVLLDSWGKHSRVGDANRIKKWLESHAASS